ncbi:MAG: DinB family protein [Flavobacteriales bacterium]|nr:DinB family protein [Flavobacteriales bacterium]
MVTEALSKLFDKNLNQLEKELSAYKNADLIWVKENDVNNAPGNLCLHLTGNLQHFIGATLGNTGYVRDRENEFTCTNVSLNDLKIEIAAAKKAVTETLANLSQSDLDSSFPIEVFGHDMTTEYFMIHLQGHLNYHLGQISYHRRLLDNL